MASSSWKTSSKGRGASTGWLIKDLQDLLGVVVLGVSLSQARLVGAQARLRQPRPAGVLPRPAVVRPPPSWGRGGHPDRRVAPKSSPGSRKSPARGRAPRRAARSESSPGGWGGSADRGRRKGESPRGRRYRDRRGSTRGS